MVDTFHMPKIIFSQQPTKFPAILGRSSTKKKQVKTMKFQIYDQHPENLPKLTEA